MKLEMPILRLFLICKKSKTKRHRQKSKGANEGLDWGKDERNLGKSVPWLLTSNTTPHHSQGACYCLKKGINAESFGRNASQCNVSAQKTNVHLDLPQMYNTLFKHEIEEASEQLGATTGWITTNVGHKVRRIKALNSVRLPKHKHTGPQAGPQVRLHIV